MTDARTPSPVAEAGTEDGDDRPRMWEEHRSHLFGIAYRMLGSVSDSEDVLQDAYLRLHAVDTAEIERPRAWLATVVARLCLNRLTAARAQRETYIGPWLPEPVLSTVDEPQADPEREAILAESLSTAFLVMLETMSPPARVAFILHDVFGYPYQEIAAVLERGEAACRQLVHRARRTLGSLKVLPAGGTDRHRAIADAFIAACRRGEVEALLPLLAPEVIARTDGGGVASAARREIRGADRVARLVTGVLRKHSRPLERLDGVNGTPGIGLRDHAGELFWILSLTLGHEGTVTHVDIVTNPEKLRHLLKRSGDGRVFHPGTRSRSR